MDFNAKRLALLAGVGEYEDRHEIVQESAQQLNEAAEERQVNEAEDQVRKAVRRTIQKMLSEGSLSLGKELQTEGYTDDELRALCHSKDHDCAVVVEHPVWGRGKPIYESHALPDDEGNVEWYDVQFKHGIEKKVMAEDVTILEMEEHMHNEEEDEVEEGAHEDSDEAMIYEMEDGSHQMEMHGQRYMLVPVMEEDEMNEQDADPIPPDAVMVGDKVMVPLDSD